MLNRAQKQEWAASFKEKLQKSKVAIFADYKGLKSGDADSLRRKLRDKGAEVKVLNNRIARKAVQDGALGPEVKQVMDQLVGPVLVAFAYSDPAGVSKILNDFAKDNEVFTLRDSVMESRKVSAKDIEALANLPSREVLLAMVLGALNGVPRNFVSVLAAVPRSLVNVLSAIERKKQESGQ